MPRLSIDIEARLAQFQDGLNRMERDARSTAQRVEGAFGAVGKAIAALGVGLSVGALARFVQQGIDAADQLNKLSQKVGVSVESLSALQYAAKLSDVSIEQLQQGLTRLNVTLAEGQAGAKEQAEAFARLQLNPAQFSSTEQALEAIASRLSEVEDGYLKTDIAVKLFGRSGAELLPLLNQGAEGLRRFKEEAAATGQIISTEMARAAEDFNDNLAALRGNLEGIAITLANRVLPFVSRFTSELREGQKAFGGLAAFVTAQSLADAFRGPQASAQAYREELARLQQQLKEAPLVPEGLEFSDAAAERERSAIRARIAEVQKLIQVYEAVARAQVQSQVVEPRARARVALPANEGAQREAERRAKALADIEKKVQEDIANASANAYKLAAEVRQRDIEDAIEQDVASFKEGEEEKYRIAVEYAEKHAKMQEAQREFDEMIHKAEVKKILRRVDEENEARVKALEDQKRAARELGLVFSSAFEDAIVRGEKLSDVLNGLAQDILRMIIRKAITEPVANFVGGLFGNIFGGLFADGGFLQPGKIGIVGERGPELISGGRTGATIQPMNGAGVTIVQHIRVDSRSDRASILEAMTAAKEAAKREILDSRRRGGAFA